MSGKVCLRHALPSISALARLRRVISLFPPPLVHLRRAISLHFFLGVRLRRAISLHFLLGARLRRAIFFIFCALARLRRAISFIFLLLGACGASFSPFFGTNQNSFSFFFFIIHFPFFTKSK